MEMPGNHPGSVFSANTVNVARFLPEMAERRPGSLALRVPQGHDEDDKIRFLDLTFLELDRECDAWCARLHRAGIARGTRVLLLVPPGLPLIAIFFALFKIGAVPVVIDPGMGRRTFLQCVTRSQPEALVAIPRGILIAYLFRPSFASVRFRVSVAPRRRRALAGDNILSHPVAATDATELAAVLFTSGSTGAPKGVRYQHGMFEAQVQTIRETYHIEPGEVDLPLLPVFALFNPALGMTTVVPEIDARRPATLDPAAIVQTIQQCGVTNSFGAPILWRKIGDYCLAKNITLPTIRRILMAGAPVSPTLMADFRQILTQGRVHSPYGATEALPVTSVDDQEILNFTAMQTAQGGGTCIGRSVAGVEVAVIELTEEPISRLEDATIQPPGGVGEIIVRGKLVTREYDRMPAATRAAKIIDAQDRVWHRLGDLGYIDAHGRLWFCGRKAERVTTPDRVLFTECCEPIFNAHPAVGRTALIGRGGPESQTPAIVIEPRSNRFSRRRVDRLRLAGELRELGRACVATARIEEFFFYRRFPVDVRHNAKIHRLKLAEVFAHKDPIRIP